MSDPDADGRQAACVPHAVLELNRSIRLCRRCQLAGYLGEARPVVFDGGRRDGIMLIGQAPGIVEFDGRIPFGGRAGKELFRWLASIDIEERDFRDHVYMGAITRCFPGKNPKGSGDRKPSRGEIDLCAPWLEASLDVLRPSVIIPVGTLAISRYLPKLQLEEVIGRQFQQHGLILIPLPHPSGASRWLNDSSHRSLLRSGLTHVRSAWNEFVIQRNSQATLVR